MTTAQPSLDGGGVGATNVTAAILHGKNKTGRTHVKIIHRPDMSYWRLLYERKFGITSRLSEPPPMPRIDSIVAATALY